jgi:citrate lyase subunit beta/citryl-CoA lyase
MPDLAVPNSLLYVPASNEKALAKVTGLPCDCVILDLEDAVAPDQKQAARLRAAELIESGALGTRLAVLRINALGSEFAKEDLALVARLGRLSAVLVPKIDYPEEIARVESALHRAAAELRIWAMIETPRALLNLSAIAETANRAPYRLAAFVLGMNDLVKATGVTPGPLRANVQPWLLGSVLAAKASGLAIFDSVFNAFRDEEGFAAEASQAKALGFDGKSLIHPSQIGPLHAAFRASPTEIAEAKAIIAAFQLPENQGKGAIQLNGEMVELLHLEIARKTMAREALIAGREAGET